MKPIDINLLPPEHMPPPLFSIRNIILLVLSLILIAFFATLPFKLNMIARKYKDDLTHLSQMLAMYQKQKREIDKLRAREEELQRRRNLAQSLIQSREAWAPRLNALSESIPNGVWLSNVEMTSRQIVLAKPEEPSEKSKKAKRDPKQTEQPTETRTIRMLNLSGDALDVARIAELASRLASWPYFSAPRITTVTKTTRKGRSVFSFEMSVDLESTSYPQGG